MAKIYAQFVRANGLISSTICYYGGSQYSHVDIYLPPLNPIYTREALLGSRSDEVHHPSAGFIPSGVHIRPVDYFEALGEKLLKKDRLELEVSDLVAQRFYTTAASQIGHKYDKTAIWGMAANRDWRDPDNWFCSELLIWASEESGAIPKLTQANFKIFPGEACMIWEARGAAVVA